MKILSLGILIAASVFACEENIPVNPEKISTQVCGVSVPSKELDWLQKIIKEAANSSGPYCHLVAVTQGDYLDHTVFLTSISGALCCPCAGSSVFNCEGEVVFSCDPEKEAKVENKKVIWEKK